RFRFGHQVADERKKRNRDQDGRAGEAAVEDGGSQVTQVAVRGIGVGEPRQRARAAHEREDGHAEDCENGGEPQGGAHNSPLAATSTRKRKRTPITKSPMGKMRWRSCVSSPRLLAPDGTTTSGGCRSLALASGKRIPFTCSSVKWRSHPPARTQLFHSDPC